MISARLSIALALLLASSVGAQTSSEPREQHQAGVSFVSGGIGSEEAQAMREAATDYPLSLELTAAAGGPRDEYISNAEVRIVDSQGALVLDTLTLGPIMLVRLPVGTYAVDVEWHGVRRQKSVEVGTRPQHILVEFPGSAESR
jgi:hypothetical protein